MKYLFIAVFVGLLHVGALSAQSIVNLNSKNTLIFQGSLTDDSVDFLSTMVLQSRIELDSSKELYLVINSGGGSYFAAEHLKDFLVNIPHLSLICVNCHSGASLVFATFKGPRLVSQDSKMILHEMYMNHVTAASLKDGSLQRELSKNSDEFNDELRAVLKMSKEDYEKKILDTEWEVSGDEMVKLGLATKLVRVRLVFDDIQVLPMPNPACE